MRESSIEDYLHDRVRELGGGHRRLSWIGRKHAPDDCVTFEANAPFRPGTHFLAECKRPGETLRPGQEREIERLRSAGFEVHVFSSHAEIDAVLPKP